MAPIRWGVISGSEFASRVMARAIHESDGAVLAAVATGSAEKAARFSAFAPDIRVMADYDALLADPGIDAVYIPLPNALHIEWSLKALAAGKHVLTEKPIAMTAPEIDALIEARDRTGLVAVEAYMIAHHPQWHKVRSLLAGGAIGELKLVDAVFSFVNADTGNIRNRSDVGGGSLRDIGVYTMGSVRLATGLEPQSVDCQIDWEGGIDATAHVQAQFPGFAYRMTTSMRMARWQQMSFHGTEGTLQMAAPYNAGTFAEAQVALIRPNGPTEVFRFPDVRQYRLQVEAFGNSVRTGAAYPWTLEDARGTQAFIDLAYAAAGPAKG